ncbi:MAG: hypothetical protein K2K76_04135, partial [Muribaculaceae bacterium]|nr:hypothetical protein [Muribaculaceae bacterium]
IITTLSSLCSMLGNTMSGLFGGVVSGLIATHVYRKQIKKVERTNIKISEKIARSFIRQIDGSKITVYRVKISNETPQDAYEVKGYVRLRYKGCYLTMNLSPVPILHGNNGVHQPSDYQREFPFRLIDIRESKIIALKNSKLLRLYRSKVLRLEDFADENTILEIVIMSTDSISGSVLNAKMETWQCDDFPYKVKDGKFAQGTLDIEKRETPHNIYETS